jgi:hypothetical protein
VNGHIFTVLITNKPKIKYLYPLERFLRKMFHIAIFLHFFELRNHVFFVTKLHFIVVTGNCRNILADITTVTRVQACWLFTVLAADYN